jgi:hypothetical protein
MSDLFGGNGGGATVMTAQSYRERLPMPQLGGEVACVWTQEVAAAGPAYEHRTVPNGCVEISHALGTDVVAVAGTQRQPTVGLLAPGTTVVGVRLRPGAATSILASPASELVDLHVGLDELWGRSATTLAGQLTATGSPQTAVQLLEEEILRRRAVTAADPLVNAAIERLQPWQPDDIGAWCADLCISARQLRRRFVAALGYGPKTLQRILRFQGFLALSQQHDAVATLTAAGASVIRADTDVANVPMANAFRRAGFEQFMARTELVHRPA